MRTRFAVLGMALAGGIAAAADPKTDAYGDPLPEGAVARLGSSRGVMGVGSVVPLPPDFTRYAAVAPPSGGAVVVCRVATGEVVGRFGGNPVGRSGIAAVSADGKRVATSDAAEIAVWDVATGRRVGGVKYPPGAPHTVPHEDMAVLSADGGVLAVGGVSTGGPTVAATVWDVATGERRAEVAVEQPFPLVPALSPDGKTLAAWAAVPTYYPGAGSVPGPAVHPAAWSVRLWDAATGKPLAALRTTRPRPARGVFSSDGRTFAVCTGEGRPRESDGEPGRGGAVERWDVASGRAAPPLPLPSSPHRVAFGPDGKALATTGPTGIVQRWRAADGQLLDRTEPPADRPPAYLPRLAFADADRVVAAGAAMPVVVAWEAPSGKPLTPSRGHWATVVGVGFPAGQVLTSGQDGRTIRWDRATGKPAGVLRAPTPRTGDLMGMLMGVSVSPDGSRGVAPYLGGLFDPLTGAQKFRIPPAADVSIETYASPDRSHQAVLRRLPDGSACDVWDLVAGRKVAELALPSLGGVAIGFSPSNARLVHAGSAPAGDGADLSVSTLVVTGWDLKTGKQVATASGQVRERGTGLRVAAADETSAVLVCGGRVRAVDFAGGRLGDEVDTGHDGGSTAEPVFDPAGKRFAVPAGNLPGEYGAKVFDWPSGKPVKTFAGHAGRVTVLAFSPDGKALASGSDDTTVLLWDVADPAPKK